MSTMIENRWDPRMQNQQGPITSGFVSNSDIRQRERQEQIKWERQREYEDYQSKPWESMPEQQPNSPVYYKVGSTGGMSLPIGGYEESRKIYDDQRQKECIDFMAKKKDAEEKKREDRYVNAQRSYRPPPEAEMYDHNQITRELNEEKKKEYNDYLDNPNMGFRQYEERKKLLSQERKTEYNRFLDNKQQKEQLYTRAKAEGEIPVINRVSPTHQTSPRGRPPPHPEPERRAPSYDQPSQDRQRPNQYGQSDNEIRTGFFDDRRISPLNRDTRHDEYQDYLNKKHKEEDMRRQRLEEQRNAPRPEIRKGDYYDADAYEQKKQNLNSQRKEEYQNFLSKQKGATAQKNGEADFETQRRVALAQERNKEYNDFIENKDEVKQNKVEPLNLGEDFTTKRQKELAKERHQEYLEFLDKANQPSNRLFTPEDLQGLPMNQQRYDRQRRYQEMQRNKEYNEHLSKKGGISHPDEEQLSRRDMTLKTYMENQTKSEMHDKFRNPVVNDTAPENFGLPIGQHRYDEWKKHLEQERTKEMQELQAQKYGSQPTKRMPDQPNPGTIGFVAGMGYHERERERMNKQRQDEYNKYLNEDSWYRQEPPPFNKSPGTGREQERPRSYRRQPTPSYQDILDSKRKEEASYRRFDDPEYSRTGGPGERPYDRYD